MHAAATVMIVGDDVRVGRWVQDRLGVEDWGPYVAIGIERGGILICGVVYNNFRWPSIEASIAASEPSWASARNLAQLFAFPFGQLKCRRVGAHTAAFNHRAQRFLRRLGFRHEGVCREALRSGDAVLFGMTAAECPWWPQRRALADPLIQLIAAR